MAHRAGFVNIIGNPNVGKSTLMNALVGERLSIITSKAQTTRHRIMGIVNGEDFQIVYSDTPGLVNPGYKLHESMMGFVNTALIDADVFMYVVEVGETKVDPKIVERINRANVPIIIIINKIDLADQEKVVEQIEFWSNQFVNAEVMPVSALHKFNLEKVFDSLLEKLPENPPYYPKDELSDKSQRFFASEIVREKILLHYQKEIPYSVEVIIESFEDEQNIIRIKALIFVARQSQKGILIGHKGQALKRVGIEARKEMESFFDKHVYLELYVKVSKDWRDDDQQLKRFGYNID